MISVLILEGVTGSGKSQTLRALQEHPSWPSLVAGGRVVSEEETLGEFMAELQQPDLSIAQRLVRLQQVLDELEQVALRSDQRPVYVLERFHFSYYALLPDWTLYRPFDDRLRQLHSRLVLLDFDVQLMEERALDRIDRQDSTWTHELITYYGSREEALRAIVLSQARRRESLAWTTLPAITIDTTAMNWPSYANQIIAFWQKGAQQ